MRTKSAFGSVHRARRDRPRQRGREHLPEPPQPRTARELGPRLQELVYGTATAGQKGITGRTYSVEGEARVRPPGLGSDEGFGAGTGTLALPAILALIATTRGRRRWTFALLALGALAAVATGAGRIEVVGAVLAVLAFALLLAQRGATRDEGARRRS